MSNTIKRRYTRWNTDNNEKRGSGKNIEKWIDKIIIIINWCIYIADSYVSTS